MRQTKLVTRQLLGARPSYRIVSFAAGAVVDVASQVDRNGYDLSTKTNTVSTLQARERSPVLTLSRSGTGFSRRSGRAVIVGDCGVFLSHLNGDALLSNTDESPVYRWLAQW